MARRARELVELPTARRSRGEPVPPRRLRARTGAPGIREFALGGGRAAQELAAVLPEPLAAYREILDFGCGSARVLPHIAALAPDSRCAGCDIDRSAVGWARAHHPGLGFVVSRYQPPLPFPDRSFDLIYSISVLSHLDEALQDLWLAELARVLRPGATALLSVHGAHAFERFRTGQVRTAWCAPGTFARDPLLPAEFVLAPYIRSVWNRGDLPGVGQRYGLAFHGEQYIERHWSRWFNVDRVVPRGLTDWQDLILLTLRPDSDQGH